MSNLYLLFACKKELIKNFDVYRNAKMKFGFPPLKYFILLLAMRMMYLMIHVTKQFKQENVTKNKKHCFMASISQNTVYIFTLLYFFPKARLIPCRFKWTLFFLLKYLKVAKNAQKTKSKEQKYLKCLNF